MMVYSSLSQEPCFFPLCTEQRHGLLVKGMNASVLNDLAQAFEAYSDGQWITTP